MVHRNMRILMIIKYKEKNKMKHRIIYKIKMKIYLLLEKKIILKVAPAQFKIFIIFKNNKII
jgi:hypothetical protein